MAKVLNAKKVQYCINLTVSFSKEDDEWVAICQETETAIQAKTIQEAEIIIKNAIQANLEGFDIKINKKLSKKQFDKLVKTWKNETGALSRIDAKILNENYQEIISLGWTTVPLIIEELRKNPDHWFYALKSITKIDPVKPEDKGNIEKVANRWIQWWDSRSLGLLL